MKKISLLVLTAVMLSWASASWAITQSQQFVVSASVPAATGISISATRVAVQGNVFGQQVTALNFDPLTFNALNGIWVPDHYFAIDVGGTGGAGTPAVTVTFGSESSPAGQTKGLGSKATATFVKITGAPGSQVETPLTTHGPKKLLKSITAGENITANEINGGFFRTYVGIYTGGDAAIDTAGGEPFTNGDKPGSYTGTLTITATIP